MTKKFRVITEKRTDFIDITAEVKDVIRELNVTSGFCVVYVPHTTAGITINEGADPAVTKDITAQLEKIAPRDAGYSHMEGNADSHIKASIMGSSVVVNIDDGTLILGTWQSIYFCEFDGPRHREVIVKVVQDPTITTL